MERGAKVAGSRFAYLHDGLVDMTYALLPGLAESLNLTTAYGGLTTIDHYADGAWVVQAVNAPVVRRGSWGGRTFKP